MQLEIKYGIHTDLPMVRAHAWFYVRPLDLYKQLIFKTEFALVVLRAKSAYHPSIDSWLEAYV